MPHVREELARPWFRPLSQVLTYASCEMVPFPVPAFLVAEAFELAFFAEFAAALVLWPSLSPLSR